jgi:hypothetical protein
VSPEELAAHRKRFLDTMEKAWHEISATLNDPKFPLLKLKEMDVYIELSFDETTTVIVSNPIIPMQGDFDPWAPTRTVKTG